MEDGEVVSDAEFDSDSDGSDSDGSDSDDSEDDQ